MGTNNPLKLNDIYAEINYDYKCYDLFFRRLFGGNEMDP